MARVPYKIWPDIIRGQIKFDSERYWGMGGDEKFFDYHLCNSWNFFDEDSLTYIFFQSEVTEFDSRAIFK